MKVGEVLQDISASGIRIEANGEKLCFTPKSAVTPELWKRMKTHKSELLALLRKQSANESSKSTLTKPPSDVHRVCQTVSPAGAASGDIVRSGAKTSSETHKECNGCGSTYVVEFIIHSGQSSRLDCGKCIEFKRWYSD